MSGIFDGLAGVLADTFGAPVTYHPQGNDPARSIRSIFRENPLRVLDEGGGAVLTLSPTWRVPRDLAQGIARGDQIEPRTGEFWRILNRQPSGSPADDRFVIFELERVSS